MTVLAVNGSPRAGGNTAVMLEWVLDELTQAGFNTELAQIGGQPVRGCLACGSCAKLKACSQKDAISELTPQIFRARAVVLGSPVYFSDLTPELKALIDRVGFVNIHSGSPLRRKVGAAVAVARRAGHVHTLDSINHFFGITEMITVGSSYWNMGFGVEKGDVRDDEEAQRTMRVLGRNIAWLLKKIHG
ncbi:MAG: flavodoxin family protein [Deltaproteobacteria bacterium]|jgi:multimeric flavodoxin WrbA|nr:flavodoxin family protein [Deltaproteobacteria bacterium]